MEEFKPHLDYLKANFGEVGELTPYADEVGNPLYIGDIVEVHMGVTILYDKVAVMKKKRGAYYAGPYRLSTMCDNRKLAQENHFIIYAAEVTKIRSFEDIEDGEVVDDFEYIKSPREVKA